MSRPKGSTRLDDALPQGTPDDVSPSVVRRANRILRRWLEGEVDKMECVTTPSGERIVQPYNRDRDSDE